jgi:hypothetical protein
MMFVLRTAIPPARWPLLAEEITGLLPKGSVKGGSSGHGEALDD